MKTETKATEHTPGPWAMSRDAVPPWHVQVTIYAETGGRSTRVATAFEDEANAHLIAAAPELLKALKAMLDVNHELGAISRPVADEARAAVAKAEGR